MLCFGKCPPMTQSLWAYEDFSQKIGDPIHMMDLAEKQDNNHFPLGELNVKY